jgi:hypothetical protein
MFVMFVCCVPCQCAAVQAVPASFTRKSSSNVAEQQAIRVDCAFLLSVQRCLEQTWFMCCVMCCALTLRQCRIIWVHHVESRTTWALGHIL